MLFYCTKNTTRLRLHLIILNLLQFGGGERARTADLLLAKQALSHLSYTPKTEIYSTCKYKGVQASTVTFLTISQANA